MVNIAGSVLKVGKTFHGPGIKRKLEIMATRCIKLICTFTISRLLWPSIADVGK
jgi:hypothetical protein